MKIESKQQVSEIHCDWSDEKGSRVKIPHELVTVIAEQGKKS